MCFKFWWIYNYSCLRFALSQKIQIPGSDSCLHAVLTYCSLYSAAPLSSHPQVTTRAFPSNESSPSNNPLPMPLKFTSQKGRGHVSMLFTDYTQQCLAHRYLLDEWSNIFLNYKVYLFLRHFKKTENNITITYFHHEETVAKQDCSFLPVYLHFYWLLTYFF